MPSWICKQPNGNYARYSTIVDAITFYEATPAQVLDEMINRCGLEVIDEIISDADNEMGTAWEPRIKHEPLHRWNDAISSMIFHFKVGQSSSSKEDIIKIITECGDDPERWVDEFAKPVEEEVDN